MFVRWLILVNLFFFFNKEKGVDVNSFYEDKKKSIKINFEVVNLILRFIFNNLFEFMEYLIYF